MNSPWATIGAMDDTVRSNEPTPLMELVDIGANLTHESFHVDLHEVLARASRAGVSQMVVTGSTAAESVACIELAQAHRQRLFATAGVHPHHAREWDSAVAESIAGSAQHDCVVAVGEAGLDFNRDFSPRDDQERVFIAQLRLAAKLGKPLFLHERDAFERFHSILREHRPHLGAVVVHCFTGNDAALDAYLELDLHIGITGWICDERRGLHLRELVPRIPANRLMVETDAPYLLPRDLRPKPKSRRNEPSHLAHILQQVAQARGEDAVACAERTTATARAFFRLPSPSTAQAASE
ncbi:MAG: TatD DNase family protein [Gammaproteobacteria bacterium]|jgi:TatD DNase family protein